MNFRKGINEDEKLKAELRLEEMGVIYTRSKTHFVSNKGNKDSYVR
jgi:hypothetical protein